MWLPNLSVPYLENSSPDGLKLETPPVLLVGFYIQPKGGPPLCVSLPIRFCLLPEKVAATF